jgi:hypothetical protein
MAKCSQLATPNGLRLDQLLIYCWRIFFFWRGEMHFTDYEGFGILNCKSAHYAHLADIIQFIIHGWIRTALDVCHP